MEQRTDLQKWCKKHCHPGAYCPDGYCTEAREAVTARVKRALPPAPEPTTPPEKTDQRTAMALSQIKYDQVTSVIKHKNIRRKKV